MITATLLLTAALLAQPGPYRSSSRTGSTTVQLPSQLNAGDQLYEGNLGGLRRYLDDVREGDQELFTLLDPKLRKLEDQQRLAWTVGLSGAAVGVVMIGAGMYMTGQAMGYTDPSDQAAWDRSQAQFDTGLMLSGGGVGVAALSILSIVLISPNRAQFMDLINEHNRARPDQPLRLQLGFGPAPRGHGGVAFAYAAF